MKKQLRLALGKAHLWLGLALGLYFLLMGVTGSLLVFGREVDQWHEADVHRVRPGRTQVPVARILAAYRKRYPHAKVGYVSYPRTPDSTFNIRQSMTGWQQRYTYFNPYTGQIVGERTRAGTFYGFLCYLHFYLAMGQVGWTVNGYGAILLTLLMVSGGWIWWPKARTQWRVRLGLRRNRGTKVLVHDLHNVLGIYPLAFLLMFAVTAIVFAFKEPSEKLVFALTGVTQDRPVKVASVGKPLPLDLLVASADRAVDGRVQRVNLPKKVGDPVVVRKEWDTWNQTRDRAEVSVDPSTGKILRVDDSRRWPIGRKVIQWAVPIHFGLIGGLATRIIWVALGLAPVVLALTGALQWWYKRSARAAARSSRAQAATATAAEAQIQSS
ncbi:MAG: PepSY-associated TM helix domain-containing protein [Armatimonadetes bacterium]|nr:PepSY-associated TM helix domain-containing protein [Armatimonadota bacterium]